MIKNLYPAANATQRSKPDLKGNEKQLLKILMLEDDVNDAELLQVYLNASSLHCKSTVVSCKKDYIEKLNAEEFDIILSDHNIPNFNSLEALKIRNENKLHIPFILVSGTIPEEYAVTILKEGANDYILKDRPHRLIPAITEAIKKQKAISDKILAEEELKKINERLRLVGKATADAIWDWNIITHEVTRGEGFEILFGYKLSEIGTDQNSLSEHIHPDDKDKIMESITDVINSKNENWAREYRYQKADGSYSIVMDKGIVIRDENGAAYRMVGAMQDITHIRQLEMEILEQRFYHQKQKTEIAFQAQEEERHNIGKELHDNINQLMAFSKMMIDTARKSPEMRDMCIDKSYEGINLAIEEIRKLSHSIVQPAFSDQLSFVDAVNQLVEDINLCNKIDIKVNIPLNGPLKKSSEKVKLTFYRIIQEQLNNILKYSQATSASIELSAQKKVFRLTISDNGVGIKAGKKLNGIGLTNISSRAELLSGSMQIISSPGKGCTVIVEIPFK
ncbi:MAG TPA: PAS domain-containing protein [Ferruginibacter sp.]|nr:PAS domain-containing protein [Ferruginibacter sp.]